MERFIVDETKPPITPQHMYLQFVRSYMAMLLRCGVNKSDLPSRDTVRVVKTFDHVEYPEEELCKYKSDAAVQVLREHAFWDLIAGCTDELNDPLAPNEAGRKHLARLAACSGDLAEPSKASFLGVDIARLHSFVSKETKDVSEETLEVVPSGEDNSIDFCFPVHIYGQTDEWRMLFLILREAFEKEGCLDAVPEDSRPHLRVWVDRAIAAIMSFSCPIPPIPGSEPPADDAPPSPVATTLPLLSVRKKPSSDSEADPSDMTWQVGGFLNALLPYDSDTPFDSGFIPWIDVRPEDLSFEEDWPCNVIVPDEYREPIRFKTEEEIKDEIDEITEPDPSEEYVLVDRKESDYNE